MQTAGKVNLLQTVDKVNILQTAGISVEVTCIQSVTIHGLDVKKEKVTAEPLHAAVPSVLED